VLTLLPFLRFVFNPLARFHSTACRQLPAQLIDMAWRVDLFGIQPEALSANGLALRPSRISLDVSPGSHAVISSVVNSQSSPSMSSVQGSRLMLAYVMGTPGFDARPSCGVGFPIYASREPLHKVPIGGQISIQVTRVMFAKGCQAPRDSPVDVSIAHIISTSSDTFPAGVHSCFVIASHSHALM
jgi:hypothetical protein